ncbi:hypothetical protein HJB86_26670 [Rhizobium sp. NZLR3b]|uniref:hypothetical protein n=1 Tax=Rhizobium sp. NZLR3b TaxID=2731101 RepID=UPI001C835D39|nr:hypothetical protein [Rhizobium sp. NZLR3b]MBX5192434.1 hypothetical protein [Rhizobium sp. NZLR3b]
MIKRIGIYVAIAAAWGLVYAAKEHFGIPDVWMWIGLIAMIGALTSFNFESRLQEVEARVVRKDYAGIIEQLEGQRHKPQQKQPNSLAAGGAIVSWIRPEHEVLFEDFRWFAAVLNQHLPDPWAIEELPRTDARGYEGPEIGRMYEVWYNACKVGRMQVTVGSGLLLRQDKSEDERAARVELTLNYLRFIPYEDARALLYELHLMIGPFKFNDAESSRSRAGALAADELGGHLWECVRNSDFDPIFDFLVDGPYDLLREQTDRWKKHGIDPMVKWGGDRDRG